MPKLLYPTVLLAALLAAGGCRGRKAAPVPPSEPLNYAQELPPGAVALRKASPGEYPDFAAALQPGDVNRVRAAIAHSLAYLQRPSSRRAYPYLDITHERAVATLAALDEVLRSPQVSQDPSRLNRLIAERFDVYKSVGAPGGGGGHSEKVLFTGYFTPTYDASLTATTEYRWPLYRRPADLVSDPATGETAGRRLADGRVVPYPTRAEIERDGLLRGHEIAWLKDRWEAYVVTVQGSARLRLTDGRILELGYAGHNGREYASPAMKMVADGVLRKEDVSAATLRDYFAKRPEAMDTYLWHNPRTVFFDERPGGPFGSLNVPVTPRATIATDKKVYPPGMPALAVLRQPLSRAARRVTFQRGTWEPRHLLVLDQDTGGAIRAAGRCDVYFGVGESAERQAGELLSEGELFYLAVK